jgi:hypothetical protein
MPLIYVALLDEGVDVRRPVEALHLGADRFLIVIAPQPTERWRPHAAPSLRDCVHWRCHLSMLKNFYDRLRLLRRGDWQAIAFALV